MIRILPLDLQLLLLNLRPVHESPNPNPDRIQLGLGLILILSLRPIILSNTLKDKAIGTAQETIEPEEIQGLKCREQRKSDDIRQRGFVLLHFPVELVGADGAEFREDGVEDEQVDVVPEIDPDGDT